MNIVYSKRQYYVYKIHQNAFIVHNTSKEFKYGHTHISNYNTAKYILNLSLYQTVPKHLSQYLIVSVIRISTDLEYILQMKELLKNNNAQNLYINKLYGGNKNADNRSIKSS